MSVLGVSCHQGDKPKGGLSLVSAKQALAGGESSPAIERGKPDESLLIELISGDKPGVGEMDTTEESYRRLNQSSEEMSAENP